MRCVCMCDTDLATITMCNDLMVLLIWNGHWLAVVELGLLKGRHPLLKDADVTLNPSKGLAWVESTSSDKSSRKSNGTLEQASSVDVVLVKDEGNSIADERGQVLQTAQVAMNMLDMTMPGTLNEEQKQKVLLY
ncbi:hypothetical protein TEA_001306 [Camellia sinensis var. sinensis]|uniref:DUF7750 domain-containing protein n=1 Tax=Camellia sinensis var. sinensis TaxID=542762 RepID=A0A4S4EF91_CAMSN|nr:hypothetical protein TEA_001306 [Camellia sinensis var. sinensis]